ncbi:MAG TPA: hypothetical protein PK765_02330 [bacterium]|nr:hypothetical protein [bacterium]
MEQQKGLAGAELAAAADKYGALGQGGPSVTLDGGATSRDKRPDGMSQSGPTEEYRRIASVSGPSQPDVPEFADSFGYNLSNGTQYTGDYTTAYAVDTGVEGGQIISDAAVRAFATA